MATAIKGKTENIADLLMQYDLLKQQEKTIKAQKDKLSAKIKSYAESFGVKDDKGSFYSETDKFVFGKVARKSVNFDKDKAIEFFRRKGFSDCIDYVEVINEGQVEVHIDSGDITIEDLEGITVVNTTYAVDVRAKEEVTDTVEEVKVPLAASKKPSLFSKSK